MLDREQRWGVIGGALLVMRFAADIGTWTIEIYILCLATIVFALGDWLWQHLRSRSWPVTIGTVESRSMTPNGWQGYVVSFGYSYSIEGKSYGSYHDEGVFFNWNATKLFNALDRAQLQVRYNPADSAISVPDLPRTQFI